MPADCRRVFEWANDPETRKASFFDAPIPLADHERWYADSLDGDRRILRIAEVDATPVGLIRFDRDTEDPKAAEMTPCQAELGNQPVKRQLLFPVDDSYFSRSRC